MAENKKWNCGISLVPYLDVVAHSVVEKFISRNGWRFD